MLSICIIVKNEEENLRRCLQKLKPLNYEIVVIDTGSSDHSKVVAMEYTNKVYDFVWCDDFSKAKNYAIQKATNQYILVVDSDEFLIDIKKKKMEELIIKYPYKVGKIYRRNIFESKEHSYLGNEWVNRLFLKEKFHYVGKIHEQVEAYTKEEYMTYNLPIFFEHNGYNGDKKRKEKSERNIYLLQQALKEEESPYIYYQLGKSYYFQKNYKIAVDYFEKAISYDLNPKLEYVQDLVETYGYALLNAEQQKKALMLENVYQEFSGNADYIFMLANVYLQNGFFEQAIKAFEIVVNFKTCKIEGVNSYLAYYNIGIIYECMKNEKKALEYYKKCGNYNFAIDRIKNLSKI